MVGVDPSNELLERFASDALAAGLDVDLRPGRLDDLDAVLGDRRFDVVCAHGLLMYLDDPDAALAQLAARLEPDGILSVTFRNRAALAFRPGMRRQWQAAVDAFDAVTYVNELDIDARADHLDDVAGYLTRRGLVIDAWYGVRVFTDPASGDERVVDGKDFEQQGRRYAVVLQPGWLTLSTWVVALTSTSARETSFRPAVEIGDRRTLVMCDQIGTVNLNRLTEPTGFLTLEEIQRVDDALALVLDL